MSPINYEAILTCTLQLPLTRFLLLATFRRMDGVTYPHTDTPITPQQITDYIMHQTDPKKTLNMGGIVAWLTQEDSTAGRWGGILLEEATNELTQHLAMVWQLRGQSLTQEEVELTATACAHTLTQHGANALTRHSREGGSLTDRLTATLLQHPPLGLHQSHNPLLPDIYHDLIRQTCNAVVNLTDKPLAFTADTLQTSLSNRQHVTNTLMEEVSQTLATLHSIYQASIASTTNSQLQTYEQRYRDLLATQLDRMTMFGGEMVTDHAQPLTVAYINLKTRPYALTAHQTRLPSAGSGNHSPTEPAEVGTLAKRGDLPKEPPAIPAPEALATAQRLLIVGKAGAGKTTLMKWITVTSAKQHLPPALHSWANSNPVYVRLRQFANAPLPPLHTLPTSSEETQPLGQSPQATPWAERQFAEGRALLLLDGLDEVSEQQRTHTFRQVAGWLALYPQMRCVVTTRPDALTDEGSRAWFAQQNFTPLTLEPLDAEGMENLVTQWHTAMGDERCWLPPHQKEGLPTLEEKLLASLESQPRLRNIAQTPLLCAMLCALHQARKSQLPTDRIELYEACIEMLLRRDPERQIDHKALYGLTVPVRQQRLLLGKLAYWMMLNGQSEMSQADAFATLNEYQWEPANLLALLAERSGVLQRQGHGLYDFVHRTFQEYLAARRIKEKRDFGLLANHLTDSQWHETIRLTAGVCEEEEQQITLLKGLQSALQQQVTEVEDQTGVYRVLYESYCLMPTPTANVAAHATPPASWQEKEMLNLDEWAINDLSPLANLINLQVLDIQQTAVSDLHPLSHLNNLQILDVMQTTVSDLSPLTHLNNLQELFLEQTAVSDLNPLANLSNLQVLFLDETSVSDLSPLAHLTSLQLLIINQTKVTSLAPLATCTGLQVLDLCQTAITDLRPILELPNLKFIYLTPENFSNLTLPAHLTLNPDKHPGEAWQDLNPDKR